MTMRWLLLSSLLFSASCRRAELPPPSGPWGQSASENSVALPTFPDGKVHDLQSDLGQVVLVDVWATWCEPCRDALPLYAELAKSYGPRGFRVYTINVDEDSKQVEAFVKETGLSLPILLDPNARVAERVFRVRLMPTTYLLDRKGTVRFTHEGFSEEFLPKYRAEIEQLLAEP
jgi:thiol-disulfide isomerase/thioredoxin